MKSIAILLTVHNRKEKTIKCLEKIFLQEGLNDVFEVTVFLVDDGSTDGTSQAIQEKFPQVNIINGNGQLYWNRGMHKAWTVAEKTKSYDFFLWLNDDTLLHPEALSVLLNTSVIQNHHAIIVGTTSSSKDQNTITYGGRSLDKGLLTPTHEALACDYFNGNIVLIPNSVYLLNGKNDPIFHHALGDFDYGLRAKKLGIPMCIAPGILGVCDAHEELPTWCNPQKPFLKRWKTFRTPLGHNPEEYFIYEKRHRGLIIAILHYITNHTRVIFPYLWK